MRARTGDIVTVASHRSNAVDRRVGARMADTEARDVAEDRPASDPDPAASASVTEGSAPADTAAPVATATDDGSDSGGSGTTPTRRGKHEHGSGRRFVGSTPFLIIVALAVALIVKTFLVQAFYIPSESMEPTLMVGDRVFVNKLVYDIGDIHRGDVIVFSNPHPGAEPQRGPVTAFLHWLGEGVGLAQPADEDFIKRVVGLPGDTIEIRDNVVYIDGNRLDEPYLTDQAKTFNGNYPLTQIPKDSLFVMGDNRGDSADSRYGLGFVPVDKVIGRAFVIIWPPSNIGGL
jgi:signal peptidase I